MTTTPLTPADDGLLSGKVSRRAFLGFLAAAPALTVAAQFGLDGIPTALADPLGVGEFVDIQDSIAVMQLPLALDMTLTITPENIVEVVFHRAEIGQGITTMMSMLIAEELDARVEDIRITLADADALKVLNVIAGSHTTRAFYHPTRKVAAAARSRIVTAAAQRWGVDAGTLVTRDTRVFAPDGRSATYGSLSAEATNVLVPAVSPLPKAAADFRVIGTPRGRVDREDVVRGRAKWAQDLQVPGAVPTVLARPPSIGGTVRSYDATTARAMSGVLAVTPLPTGIAVSARTFGEAIAARDALVVDWAPGPVVGTSDADVTRRLRAALPPVPNLIGLLSGQLETQFEFAYLSHSPMEVRNAIADVRPDGVEIWTASQIPIHAQQRVAEALGVPIPSITLHNIRGGGSFGAKLYHEPIIEGALLSRELGRPVRVMWSRSDEVKHGWFRPASHHRIRINHTSSGEVLAYDHAVAANTLDVSWGLGDAVTTLIGRSPGSSAAFTQSIFAMTQQVPYRFGTAVQSLYEVPIGVPSAPWRGVYSGQAIVAHELTVDVLARRLKEDAVQFRLRTLKDERVKTVLRTVADKAGWGRPMPPGHGQGIAIHSEYKSAVAYCLELDCTGAQPRIVRADVAVDVGQCINPKGLEAQLQGSLVDGLSVMLWAGNHLDDGAIRESSYADFRYARMRDTPRRLGFHLVTGGATEPGGVGELGVPAASAAVAIAYARATGTTPRRFPISQQED